MIGADCLVEWFWLLMLVRSLLLGAVCDPRDGKTAGLSESVESEDQATAVSVKKCRSGNHHK